MGRSPGERNDYPLQYSGLKNSMDFIVCGVAESDTTEQFSLSLCGTSGHPPIPALPERTVLVPEHSVAGPETQWSQSEVGRSWSQTAGDIVL